MQELADLIAESERVVAFTGAGVSTESGLPDFRSPAFLRNHIEDTLSFYLPRAIDPNGGLFHFLRDDGSIVNIAEMKALDDKTNHCSAEPVRYALEMNAGWFAKRGLKPGNKLSGAPFGAAR